MNRPLHMCMHGCVISVTSSKMVHPRNDLSSDDDYDSRDEHKPWTKAHQCRMIKSVVLDPLKDFKNLRVMMIVIMLAGF
jgi:hypothetical protein